MCAISHKNTMVIPKIYVAQKRLDRLHGTAQLARLANELHSDQRLPVGRLGTDETQYEMNWGSPDGIYRRTSRNHEQNARANLSCQSKPTCLNSTVASFDWKTKIRLKGQPESALVRNILATAALGRHIFNCNILANCGKAPPPPIDPFWNFKLPQKSYLKGTKTFWYPIAKFS